MVGLSSARASADADEAVPVVVLVDDRASAAPSVLDRGGKEVVRIYRHAGMRVVWRTKTQAPNSPASPEDQRAFTVHLMVRAGLLPKSNRPSQFQMGAAPGGAIDCGGVAFLFFDQAIEFSRVHQTAAALVMGTVVAHEIGHLLLGKSRPHLRGVDARILERRRLAARLVRVSAVFSTRVRDDACHRLVMPLAAATPAFPHVSAGPIVSLLRRLRAGYW